MSFSLSSRQTVNVINGTKSLAMTRRACRRLLAQKATPTDCMCPVDGAKISYAILESRRSDGKRWKIRGRRGGAAHLGKILRQVNRLQEGTSHTRADTLRCIERPQNLVGRPSRRRRYSDVVHGQLLPRQLRIWVRGVRHAHAVYNSGNINSKFKNLS